MNNLSNGIKIKGVPEYVICNINNTIIANVETKELLNFDDSKILNIEQKTDDNSTKLKPSRPPRSDVRNNIIKTYTDKYIIPEDLKIKYPNYPILSEIIKKKRVQLLVECQLKLSEKCYGQKMITKENIRKNMKSNNGVYICVACTRRVTQSGNMSSNRKYKDIDDSFMKNIDTEEKAYLLGWISSDGHLMKSSHGIAIGIHSDDIKILETLRDIISKNLKIYKFENRNIVNLSISSTEMCLDVCRHLQIKPGKKSHTVKFPKLDSDFLTWAFIRGVFEGDGHIVKLTRKSRRRRCNITSESEDFLNALKSFCNDVGHIHSKDTFELNGDNAMNFLNSIYQFSNPKFRLERKYNVYLQYLSFVPGLFDNVSGNLNYTGKTEECKFVKTRTDAISPYNKNDNFKEFCIWIIDKINNISENITLYETGIKVFINDGYNYQLIADSSLLNLGYELIVDKSIVDPDYIITIKIALKSNITSNFNYPLKVAKLIITQ